MEFSKSNEYSSFPDSFNRVDGSTRTYDSIVIKPPDKVVTHGNIVAKLVVDSRDRDIIKYKDPNNYKIEFNEEYKDVISVALIYAQIPNSYYNIYSSYKDSNLVKGNSNLYLSIGLSLLQKFVIPDGRYTEESLLDTLNGKYGNIINEDGVKFSFIKNKQNQKLIIFSTKEFTFNVDYEEQCDTSK